MTAEEFLNKLAEERGAIVSSGDCSEMEIANARSCGRMYIDSDGLGYVLRSKEWLRTREAAYLVREVTLNGKKVKIPQGRATYEELVKLAFPSASAGVLYTVVVAHNGMGKSLLPGQTLYLEYDMTIDIAFTGNS
jgi:hypothetical protein